MNNTPRVRTAVTAAIKESGRQIRARVTHPVALIIARETLKCSQPTTHCPLSMSRQATPYPCATAGQEPLEAATGRMTQARSKQ